jgi:hypothetical protein
MHLLAWVGLSSSRPPIAPSRSIQWPAGIPPELWDLVFEELTNESLLAAAHACSAFNDRCIPIYLARNYVTYDKLSTGRLEIWSHLLPILQLSRRTPPLHTLVCSFWVYNTLGNLRFLRELVLRSDQLQELDISFPYNIADLHTRDPLFPLQRPLLTELDSILRAMAAKSAGPVIVVFRGGIHVFGRWGAQTRPHWLPSSQNGTEQFAFTSTAPARRSSLLEWGRASRRTRLWTGWVSSIHYVWDAGAIHAANA